MTAAWTMRGTAPNWRRMRLVACRINRNALRRGVSDPLVRQWCAMGLEIARHRLAVLRLARGWPAALAERGEHEDAWRIHDLKALIAEHRGRIIDVVNARDVVWTKIEAELEQKQRGGRR